MAGDLQHRRRHISTSARVPGRDDRMRGPHDVSDQTHWQERDQIRRRCSLIAGQAEVRFVEHFDAVWPEFWRSPQSPTAIILRMACLSTRMG